MNDRFLICHPITAAWEGGWSDHPLDPGGKTMFGITEGRWHEYQAKMKMTRSPVKNITKAQALTFYKSEFWEACGAARLVAGVDLATYDASVNSGVSRGRKWLLASVGGSPADTVKRICRARLSFMQSLKIWQTFGRGWGRRVADIEVKGVAMALAAAGATQSRIMADAKVEAAAAKTSAVTADRAAKTTATGAAGSAGAPVIDPSAIDVSALWILGGLAVVLAIGTVLLVIRQRAATARAEAYQGVAA